MSVMGTSFASSAKRKAESPRAEGRSFMYNRKSMNFCLQLYIAIWLHDPKKTMLSLMRMACDYTYKKNLSNLTFQAYLCKSTHRWIVFNHERMLAFVSNSMEGTADQCISPNSTFIMNFWLLRQSCVFKLNIYLNFKAVYKRRITSIIDPTRWF